MQATYLRQLKSKYYSSVTDKPLQEYPRPQMVRKSYVNLNGVWDFAIRKKGEKFIGYNDTILVPFSPECILSKHGNYIVQPDDVLYYRTWFAVDSTFVKNRTFIHFGAVDYLCTVYLNGKKVGSHKGGYTAFSVDVSDAISIGNNSLEVVVSDPTDTGFGARGKQSLQSGGIWYTAQSGIWQTVWIESVFSTYVKDFAIIPDIDSDSVKIKFNIVGPYQKSSVTVLDDDLPIASGKIDGGEVVLKLKDYELWTPEHPKLYNLDVKVDEDRFTSYFAMRKFSIVKDLHGINRFALNNKPYFLNGVLDQGYYSDGLMTAPCEKAIWNDLSLLKDLGFNSVRKHIKIEPMLYYHYCDKLGLIVWQDMVNGGGKYKRSVTEVLPYFGIHLKDSYYKLFARKERESREEFLDDVKNTVIQLKNVPSIAIWVLFNEGWGQFDSVKMTDFIKKLDTTRLIDSTSGWHKQGRRSAFNSNHIYFRPLKVHKDKKRCSVISEFGGYSYMYPENCYNPTYQFGYKIFARTEDLFFAYKKLYTEELLPLISKGLSASIYTQLSDVEEETNGFITFDRKKLKYNIEKIREINEKITL